MSNKKDKLDSLEASALAAVSFLGVLTNKYRLLILCMLLEGEKHVSELVEALNISQSATSQHLALLREQGLIKARRDRQRVYYAILDPTVEALLTVLAARFCPTSQPVVGAD